MRMKFAAEIADEIEQRGPITVPDGYVTGEAQEAWLYEGTTGNSEMDNKKTQRRKMP